MRNLMNVFYIGGIEMETTLRDELYEKDQCIRLADEINIACDDLRMNGVDLSKIKIVEEPKYDKFQLGWMEEFRKICKKLKSSGKNLKRIPITQGHGNSK